MRTPSRTLFMLLLSACLLAGGCSAIGVVASAAAGSDRPRPAQYKNLSGQTVAVWVWADQRLTTDFPKLRVDLGTALQSKLVDEGQTALKDSKLQGAVFPYPAVSVVQFQDRLVELRYKPINEAALRLGIDAPTAKRTGRDRFTRVIYVEINDLQTRLPESQQLFRAYGDATLKVVEITGPATTTIPFEESHVRVVYPTGSRQALTEDDKVNDASMYQTAVALLAHELAMRFYDVKE